MESRSLDSCVAKITSVILDLQSQNKLQDPFQDTIQAVLAVGNDWKSKGKDGIPLTYKVIEGLASSESSDTLSEYLRALTKKQLEEINAAKNSNTSLEPVNTLTQRVHDIVTEWIKNGICLDICSDDTAVDIVRTHLLLREKPLLSDELPEEHLKILQFYEAGDINGLKEHLKKIVVDVMQPNLETQGAKYESQINNVVTIIFTKIKDGHFDDISNKMSCYIEVLTYLNEKEEQWNHQAAKFSGDRVLLPPIHRAILTCYENENPEQLINLLRKVVKDSFKSFSLQRIQNKFKKMEEQLEKEGTFTGEQVVALLGTTITVGLSTLHLVVPSSANAFSTLITQIGPAITTPAFASWGIIAGFSGATIVGICIYNAYCVYRGTKTLAEACKHMITSIIPMAIASGVGILSALTLASVSHPIWLSMATFAATGLLVYLMLAPLVLKVWNWLFVDGTQQEELQKAFRVLKIDATAPDEEVRRAYRNRLRENHPDTLNRNGATQSEIAEARKLFFEIQKAFELIVSTRLQEMDSNNEESLIARLRKFFTPRNNTSSNSNKISS